MRIKLLVLILLFTFVFCLPAGLEPAAAQEGDGQSLAPVRKLENELNECHIELSDRVEVRNYYRKELGQCSPKRNECDSSLVGVNIADRVLRWDSKNDKKKKSRRERHSKRLNSKTVSEMTMRLNHCAASLAVVRKETSDLRFQLQTCLSSRQDACARVRSAFEADSHSQGFGTAN